MSTAPTTAQELGFRSGDAECAAWFFPGAGPAPDAGRSAVVMAHGFGGTMDSGLAAFAEPLAAAGRHVLAFDFRGFGHSGGGPRQVVSMARQRADYRAALAAAAALPDVDPRRLVLWGESLSGGTVIQVAAGRDDVAAVISLVPLVDGLAAAVAASRHVAPGSMLRSGGLGVASALRGLVGLPSLTMPLAAPPGQAGALTLSGYAEEYQAIAGPSWRNEVGAEVAVSIAGFRPIRAAERLRVPWLVQIADFDRAAVPGSAAKAAVRGRAEVRHYPGDHFDVQPGRPCHAAVVAHQLHFLNRHL